MSPRVASAAGLHRRLTPKSLLVGLAVVVGVGTWYVAFYRGQTGKLDSLQSQRVSLEETVAQDDARLARLRTESAHVAQIEGMVRSYEADAPATPQLYTFVKTISQAAIASDVTITSLQPGSLEAVPNTRYSAVPVAAQVKGTYDHLLAFLHALYALPRLTGINGLSVTGGGPGASPTKTLSATFELAIYTTEQTSTKPAG